MRSFWLKRVFKCSSVQVFKCLARTMAGTIDNSCCSLSSSSYSRDALLHCRTPTSRSRSPRNTKNELNSTDDLHSPLKASRHSTVLRHARQLRIAAAKQRDTQEIASLRSQLAEYQQLCESLQAEVEQHKDDRSKLFTKVEMQETYNTMIIELKKEIGMSFETLYHHQMQSMEDELCLLKSQKLEVELPDKLLFDLNKINKNLMTENQDLRSNNKSNLQELEKLKAEHSKLQHHLLGNSSVKSDLLDFERLKAENARLQKDHVFLRARAKDHRDAEDRKYKEWDRLDAENRRLKAAMKKRTPCGEQAVT